MLAIVFVVAIVLAVLIAYVHHRRSRNVERIERVEVIVPEIVEQKKTTEQSNDATTVSNDAVPAKTLESDDVRLVESSSSPQINLGGDVIEGTNVLIVKDSPRAVILRKRFGAQSVIQRLEFEDKKYDNMMEVYKVVTERGVETFMFTEKDNDDAIVQLNGPNDTKQDPSLPLTKKKKFERKNYTASDVAAYRVPTGLVDKISNLETSYTERSSSVGPAAVDTHRS